MSSNDEVGTQAVPLEKQSVQPGQRYRHWFGTTYAVLGMAMVQTKEALTDYAEVVVYRAEDPSRLVWVRPISEFSDGRFALIETSAAPATDAELAEHYRDRAEGLSADLDGAVEKLWEVGGEEGREWVGWNYAKMAERLRREDEVALASASPLAVPDAVGARATQLDWIKPDPHEDEETLWAAPGLGGRYSISHQQSLHIGGQGHLLWWAHDGFTFAEFRTVDEAKAAAQADFDRRILSCIEPTPSPICPTGPGSDTLDPGKSSTAMHAVTPEPSESSMPENDNRQAPDAPAVEPAPVKTADDPWKVEAIETVLEIVGEIDSICDHDGNLDPKRKHELPVYIRQLRDVLPTACGAAERAAGRSRPRY